MAKKKGRRSINVARKREKRNRDRKSRQKQLAHEKQRRLLHSKSEEEHLRACIATSQKLLDEPELENMLFEPELMQKRVIEVLSEIELEEEADAPENNLEDFLVSEVDLFYPTDESVDETDVDEVATPMSEAEAACEHFRLRVIPHLLTPDFMDRLTRALTACETRLKLTGNRELAEVAFVTRSLFEAAPPEIFAFHPMIQTIGIETLRVLVEDMDVMTEGREDVKGILSDVLAQEDSESYLSESASIFSNPPLEEDTDEHIAAKPDAVASVPVEATSEGMPEIETEPPSSTLNNEAEMEQPVESEIASERLSEPEPVASQETAPAEPSPPVPTLSSDELPARALYKNFDGLAIKENFEASTEDGSSEKGLTNYALVNENEEQVEFVDAENERYVTITEDRLRLHARSEAELAVAMTEVETHCTSAVMYLAKTVEERR